MGKKCVLTLWHHHMLQGLTLNQQQSQKQVTLTGILVCLYLGNQFAPSLEDDYGI